MAIYGNGNEITYVTEKFTLTLPIGAEKETIVRESRRFGGRVERQQGDRNKHFDFVNGENETVHMVHAFHHVALCGFKGPWGSSFTNPSGGEGCLRCLDVASTKPAYRARWPPAM